MDNKKMENTETYLGEMGFQSVNWIEVSEDRTQS
jgi:hypothetical protein